MAVKGHGIAFLPTFITYQTIAHGDLVPILEHYQLPTLNAYGLSEESLFIAALPFTH